MRKKQAFVSMCGRTPRFRSEKEARRAIDSLWRAGATIFWWPFECAVCGRFHLTSRRDKSRPAVKRG